jgi:Flp pilus assembly protein TadD
MRRYANLAGAALLLAALWCGPAAAGIFGSSGKTDDPVRAADQTVDQIQRAIDDQRYLDAGQTLDQALAAASGDQRLVLLAGELSLARGHAEEAMTRFKQVDAAPTLRGRALQGEGIALSLLGRSNEAVAMLQAAVTEDPSAWRAWNALACEFDRRRDWQKAEAAYSHALTDSDNSPMVLNNRGFMRLSQQRLDEAISDFVAALQKKPDMPTARNNLRLAMAMKGEYGRSVSGAASGDRAAALNNAGYAAILRQDYGEAKKLLDEAMKAKGGYYAMAAANLEMAAALETDSNAGAVDVSRR